ncbi:ABC transporter permease [Candidatus Woesearchaeota archaeon]|nr:ABC transporter permease [Candidatus Woesearchaeota archaeon]
MIKLLELIKKNFKLLVRSKASSLVIFIGPLLLVSLLGLAYSQSDVFTLTASVYSDGYSELSESLITKMTNQNFRVVREESGDNCVGSVKRKESQACIVFPPGMEASGEKTYELTFYVDYSQINLVWLMLDVMSAQVSERSEELSKELTSDLLDRMVFVEEKIGLGKGSLDTLSAAADSTKTSSEGMRTGFQKLDISVDFSGIDVAGSKNSSDELAGLLSNISEQIEWLEDETEGAISSIESSVAAVEAAVNDTGILAELEDIDDAGDDIEEALSNASAAIKDASSNASAAIAGVKASFDLIGQKLSETNSKISNVKKERDDLLPQFDSISSNIESITASVNAAKSNLDEALAKVTAVSGKSAESIAAPITTRIEPVATQKTHFNSLFPTLLVLVIMITGILLASTLVMVEKKSKAFFRNSFTPTSYLMFNLATYLTSLIVLVIQLILFVSVSAVFFETEVLASLWLVLLLVFLASTVFICIGMFVGFVFRTEETSNLASITLIAVFLLFSSAVIPLESLPSYLKDIAMFNPFVMSEMALRQAVIFQFSISKVLSSVGLLAAYAAGIFILLVVLQSALKRLSMVHFNSIHFGHSIVKEKKARAEIAKPEKHSEPDKKAADATPAEKSK